jgi:hypothetical protein
VITAIVAAVAFVGWQLWDAQRTEERHQRGENRYRLSEQEVLTACGDAVRDLLDTPDSAMLTVGETRESTDSRAWDITGQVTASGHFAEDAVHSGIVDPTTTEVAHRYRCHVTSEGVMVGFGGDAARWAEDAFGTFAPVEFTGTGPQFTDLPEEIQDVTAGIISIDYRGSERVLDGEHVTLTAVRGGSSSRPDAVLLDGRAEAHTRSSHDKASPDTSRDLSWSASDGPLAGLEITGAGEWTIRVLPVHDLPELPDSGTGTRQFLYGGRGEWLSGTIGHTRGVGGGPGAEGPGATLQILEYPAGDGSAGSVDHRELGDAAPYSLRGDGDDGVVLSEGPSWIFAEGCDAFWRLMLP